MSSNFNKKRSMKNGAEVVFEGTIFVKTRAVALDHLCYARVSRLKPIKFSSKKLLFNSRNSHNALRYSYFGD